MEDENEAKKAVLNTKISLLLEVSESNNLINFIVSKLSKLNSNKLKEKVVDIMSILVMKEIPFKPISKYMYNGIPDDIISLRSLLWKISLNYLPLKPSEWEDSLNKSRKLYEKYKKKYISILFPNNLKRLKGDPLRKTDIPTWDTYFKDKELYESINKDILRTKSNMNFVSMPSVTNKVMPSQEIIVKAAIELKDNVGLNQTINKNKYFETNAEVMNRILFIYSKIHDDVSYVQGMNDLLAPIFYCFSIDDNPFNKRYVEADSYMTFEKLMNTNKRIFMRVNDNLPGGINYRLREIQNLLKIIDYQLFNHLLKEKVKIEFYAFRWMTLMFTQDFEMPDILRLWDTIFSSPDIFQYLNILILSPIIIRKNEIMKQQMSGIMMLVQNLEDITIYDLMNTAEKIRVSLNKKNLV